MAHDPMVYKLVRQGRCVYCASFAALATLLGLGWAIADWGRGARFARESAPAARRRGAVLRGASARRTG